MGNKLNAQWVFENMLIIGIVPILKAKHRFEKSENYEACAEIVKGIDLFNSKLNFSDPLPTSLTPEFIDDCVNQFRNFAFKGKRMTGHRALDSWERIANEILKMKTK